MLDIRIKTLWLGLGLVFIYSILALATSKVTALVIVLIFLLALLAHHIYWIHQLHEWLQNPTLASVPQGSGYWEEIFTSIFHLQRKHGNIKNELTASLERFKQTTSALPDGVVVLNQKNEIEWCNPPAERQLGIDLNQDINQPIHNYVRYAVFIEYLQQQTHTEPLRLKSLRNAGMVLQIQLISFGSKQKLLISRDITAQEKNDTMRRDFIANVSHELRTPLTVVGGFLETLSGTKGAIAAGTKKHFNMMIEQTSRMQRIIEDLLMLSRIESNTETPEHDTINMVTLLKTVQNDGRALSNKKHSIHLDVDKNLNITGNQEELLSAFSNLVSNAIRYTPKKGDIYIQWSRIDEQAVFSVRDTGIGIEEEHIARLTERFYRVDTGRSRDTGGTGLGLAIVKHILNRHKAKLEIISQPNVGSTFSIVFPKSRIANKQKDNE